MDPLRIIEPCKLASELRIKTRLGLGKLHRYDLLGGESSTWARSFVSLVAAL